jgi:hypothetical protein
MPTDVLRNQRMILAVVGGLVLVLVVALTYVMMWRPRPPQGTPPAGGWRSIWHYTPWVLALTIVGIAVYAIVSTVAYAIKPPNW